MGRGQARYAREGQVGARSQSTLACALRVQARVLHEKGDKTGPCLGRAIVSLLFLMIHARQSECMIPTRRVDASLCV